MAFEQSLADIVKKQAKALDKLKEQFDTAALSSFKSAAQSCTQIFSELSNDRVIKDSLSKIVTFAGATGQAASKKWLDGWKTNMREFKKLMGEANYAIWHLDDRLKALAKKRTLGWSESAKYTELEEKIKASAKAQQDLNDRAIYKLLQDMKRDKGKQWFKDLNKTEQDAHMQVYQDRIDKLSEMNESLDETRKSIDNLGNRMYALEMEEKRQRIFDKAFGGTKERIDKTVDAWRFIKYTVANPATILMTVIAGLVIALKALWGEVKAGIKVFESAGYVPSQWMKGIRSAANVQRAMLSDHKLDISMEDAARAAGAVAGKLGSINAPQALSNQTAYMSRMFAMSEERSAEFLAQMYRFNGRDAGKAEGISNRVASMAVRNGASAKDVFEALSQNANDFAESGKMAADEFAKAAIDAQKIGYNMASMSGLANKLVGDFEGALKTQAELSTFFPGMDMSEVMYASQFGSQNDIRTSVENMLHNSGITDFANMPRSFKMMLTKNLGMSASDLASMLNSGSAKDYLDAGDKGRLDASEDMLKAAFGLEDGGISTIIRYLRQISTSWIFGGNDNDEKVKSPNTPNVPSVTPNASTGNSAVANNVQADTMNELLAQFRQLNHHVQQGQKANIFLDGIPVGNGVLNAFTRYTG